MKQSFFKTFTAIVLRLTAWMLLVCSPLLLIYGVFMLSFARFDSYPELHPNLSDAGLLSLALSVLSFIAAIWLLVVKKKHG